MSRRSPPPHRYVYVIGPSVGLQKVGVATDPKQRLATLQTACPFDLFLHKAVAVPFADALTIERRAHRLLARSCVRNEWFETTAADAIKAVQTATAPRMSRAMGHHPPKEWQPPRFSRSPDVGPLLAFGRQFRPKAAFHKPVVPAPLPLFEFAQSRGSDDHEMADRVLNMLVQRIRGV